MREATDLGISAGVRRELAGRRIDLSKIKFPVKAGVVTLQGELCFVGIDKNIDETAVELKFIESSLKTISGLKGLTFELTNWAKNDGGTWESTQTHPGASTSFAPGSALSGDGLVCPDCDYVIRFCPCCGKPLTASGRQSSSGMRRSVPPIKPIIRKKRPVTSFASPVVASPVIEPAELIKKSPPITPLPPTPKAATPAKAPVSPVITVSPAPTKPAIPVGQPKAAPIIPATPVAPTKPAVTVVPVIPASPAIPATPAAPAAPVHTAPPQPKPVIPTTQPPQPVAAPKVPSMPTAAPKLPAQPVMPAKQPVENEDSALDSLFDNLIKDAPVAPKAAPMPVKAPAPPKKDEPAFNLDDLLGSTADDLLSQDSAAGNASGMPTFDLGDLGDFDTPIAAEQPDPPAAFSLAEDLGISEDDADLLPPLKIIPQSNDPAEQLCSFELPTAAVPDLDDDTPLPPIKPAAPHNYLDDDDTPLPPMKSSPTLSDDLLSLSDDDTPLPPMKPKVPAGKEHKDPFAALYSETELNLGIPSANIGSKDPFSSLDLDLDVLEIFPSNDEPAPLPPKKPAAGTKPAPPVDDNPFNLDNVIDLDTPVENKAKSKTSKDPFDLDDFDISKFKL